jgi:SAM-dependent methyltransferase
MESSRPAVWDNLADQYDAARRHDPVYTSCVSWAVAALGSDHALALDAGCGTGLGTTHLLSRARRVVSVDFSQASLVVLQRTSPNALAVRADVRHLPFARGTFDATLCANTLQHLTPADQVQAADELRRVTRKRLVVSVHHYSWVKQRSGWRKEGRSGGSDDIDYTFRFTRADLARLFPRARLRGIGFYGLATLKGGGRLQPLFNRLLGPLAARWRCGHMLLAITRPLHDTSSGLRSVS